MCAASKHKKLRIHSGTHYHPFHAEEARIDQLRWFDHWLKGIDTGIMDEPPVKLEIRTGGSTKPYSFRFEERMADSAHASGRRCICASTARASDDCEWRRRARSSRNAAEQTAQGELSARARRAGRGRCRAACRSRRLR